jgi:hypothetical protein
MRENLAGISQKNAANSLPYLQDFLADRCKFFAITLWAAMIFAN